MIDSYFLLNGFLVVCNYVDDRIYLGSSEAIVAEFKSSMQIEFEMSDLGSLQYFLGLEVKQANDGIFSLIIIAGI